MVVVALSLIDLLWIKDMNIVSLFTDPVALRSLAKRAEHVPESSRKPLLALLDAARIFQQDVKRQMQEGGPVADLVAEWVLHAVSGSIDEFYEKHAERAVHSLPVILLSTSTGGRIQVILYPSRDEMEIVSFTSLPNAVSVVDAVRSNYNGARTRLDLLLRDLAARHAVLSEDSVHVAGRRIELDHVKYLIAAHMLGKTELAEKSLGKAASAIARRVEAQLGVKTSASVSKAGAELKVSWGNGALSLKLSLGDDSSLVVDVDSLAHRNSLRVRGGVDSVVECIRSLLSHAGVVKQAVSEQRRADCC